MTDDRRVPPLLAERLRRGELSPEQAEDVRRRIALHGDPLAGLPSDDEVLADDPPGAFAKEVRRRAAEADWHERGADLPGRSPWPARLGWIGAFVGMLLVGVITSRVPEDHVVVKGDADDRLYVWREQDGVAVKLDATAVGAPGDRIQLSYVAPGATDGLLYSVDGRGTVTEHARWAGRQPVNGEVRLDEAYVLDDAPAFEAFVLVTAQRPLDADAVLDAARTRGASTELPHVDDADVTGFVLRKVSR